ncbi:hypothetical protein M422DRAFT_249632 [Sphaerobolus stellatus SS14]|uniref:NmrA-like domain-containing protein n=1 Tax=Sphaerobolus stellatus (strain SS14) TaxID=990650 RepID=A0A0C9T443_SPHS4|nr:hypothetical protein M422DRAFT_275724 [Sphaerobolus stellatus SS14]KIJ46889.1 hypothetical protein M422DRAFT_249632 [Sphaerobolus stellatus SS14]
MPDCPAIRVIASPSANLQTGFPPALRSVPHSIVQIEHSEGAEFDAVFRDVSIVFHDGPAIHPQEEAMSIVIIDAAKAAGVDHFILCSVFQPMRTKLRTHQTKLRIEEYLVESRLSYTILQPPNFMQNIPLDAVLSSGLIPTGFSTSVAHGFVDLNDVSLVARKVILDPARHNLAQYELVGENISYDEITSMLSRISRRNIQCEVLTPTEFVARLRLSGEVRTEYAEDSLVRMLVYYDRWGLVGNSNALKWLLGREPTKWEAYAQRELFANLH